MPWCCFAKVLAYVSMNCQSPLLCSIGDKYHLALVSFCSQFLANHQPDIPLEIDSQISMPQSWTGCCEQAILDWTIGLMQQKDQTSKQSVVNYCSSHIMPLLQFFLKVCKGYCLLTICSILIVGV